MKINMKLIDKLNSMEYKWAATLITEMYSALDSIEVSSSTSKEIQETVNSNNRETIKTIETEINKLMRKSK